MAFYWYLKAAKSGYELAQNNLGCLYEKGEGMEKNLKKAFYWFNRAAENGYEVAQYNLGECYELGIGVEKDEFKAFEFYQKSAYQGDLDAKFLLGYCYINGIGTEINREKGFELYNDAAAGKKDNCVQNILNEDDDKITNDLDKVNYWYHKAADDNNKVALYKLGEFYEIGKGIGEDLNRS